MCSRASVRECRVLWGSHQGDGGETTPPDRVRADIAANNTDAIGHNGTTHTL